MHHDSHNPESIVSALARSPFRRKFRLSADDRASVREQGLEQLLVQAHAFVAQRLAPALPENEGKQTPFRGHPVFVAQHGTATCCRHCLEKWHHIQSGRMLSIAEQDYVVTLIAAWLRGQMRPPRPSLYSPSATA